jgi:hypothetical protein
LTSAEKYAILYAGRHQSALAKIECLKFNPIGKIMSAVILVIAAMYEGQRPTLAFGDYVKFIQGFTLNDRTINDTFFIENVRYDKESEQFQYHFLGHWWNRGLLSFVKEADYDSMNWIAQNS